MEWTVIEVGRSLNADDAMPKTCSVSISGALPSLDVRACRPQKNNAEVILLYINPRAMFFVLETPVFLIGTVLELQWPSVLWYYSSE
jgi:hypothetical protein